MGTEWNRADNNVEPDLELFATSGPEASAIKAPSDTVEGALPQISQESKEGLLDGRPPEPRTYRPWVSKTRRYVGKRALLRGRTKMALEGWEVAAHHTQKTPVGPLYTVVFNRQEH